MRWLLALLTLVVGTLAKVNIYTLTNPWTYVCDSSNSSIGGHFVGPRCVKTENTQDGEAVSLGACKMTCGEFGLVWPLPESIQHSQDLVHFLPQDVKFTSVTGGDNVVNMVNKFAEIFEEYLFKKSPQYEYYKVDPFSGKPFISDSIIDISVFVVEDDISLVHGTDESYTLEITQNTKTPKQDHILVRVNAKTYYGARHGLETLSQMIAYDDLTDTLVIYKSAKVVDKPAFPHRGVLLDTARNYMSVSVIKEVIAGMSYDKLNVFHWHITDTHSFPFWSQSIPQLPMYGAYSPRKVYTPQNIKEIVEYARVRGVRVLPEFDAPAHVGNGWQYAEKEGLGKLAVCVNQEPWQKYCVEPPCGQFNIVNDNLYPELGKLYKDFYDLFESDMFHMGGDEINFNCWNTSTEIRSYLEEQGKVGTEEDLIGLWDQFQFRAAEEVYKAWDSRPPLILWTSRLTEKGEVQKYLSKEDYIIQIWTGGEDSVISELINKGYRVIFSNSDAWYLDCGYSSWVGEGNNWCSPYKGWQIVYENSPRAIYRDQGGNPENEDLILGGEAAMWSEQVDGAAVMHKLWPRLSALAERLWSDPTTSWKQAEIRMVGHREDLVERGIGADALQPQWCNQNEGLCYVNKA
jgi:hexosaminidase